MRFLKVPFLIKKTSYALCIAREVQEFSSCLLFIVSHVQVKKNIRCARCKDIRFCSIGDLGPKLQCLLKVKDDFS